MVAFFLLFLANFILAGLLIRLIVANYPDTPIGRALAFVH